MSPLAKLILKVMRVTALATSVFVALVIALQVWNHRAGEIWTHQDVSFVVVLVLMMAGGLWLARSVRRESDKY
jgi:membrane protein YdbS with pleckstrin-like domain